jgi:outer membrane protein assembly factor BamA
MQGVVLFALLLQANSWPVASIRVQGLTRFAEQDVVSQTGLKVKSPAGISDLDAACGRLMKTGLFRSCNYRYSPQSPESIDVEFTVNELPAEQRVRITIPGVEEKRLWEWLQKNEPLAKDQMPPNDDAVAFYTAAVHRFLKAEGLDSGLISSVESDLQRRQQTFVFRPKNVSAVVDVAFTGESSVQAEKLRQTLLPHAKSSGFTEIDIRRHLQFHVKPLFEQLGYLRVEFPQIQAEAADGGVRVSITVNEGPTFQLGAVRASGEGAPDEAAVQSAGFPVGAIANWDKVETAAEVLRQGLRNQGYLGARFTIERNLSDDGIVDANVVFRRGSQFTFGQLFLDGLSDFLEKRLRAQWKLMEGQPMNEGYVNDFLRAVNKQLPGSATHISVDLPIRPQSTVADVRINFSR